MYFIIDNEVFHSDAHIRKNIINDTLNPGWW